MAKFNRVLRESCCVVVAIFHVPRMLLFARFKPAFSFANIALVAVTAIYLVNGPLPKLSEKLKLILLRHGIRTVFKPPQKLGGLLSSFKDAIEPGYRQGAIYKMAPCRYCA